MLRGLICRMFHKSYLISVNEAGQTKIICGVCRRKRNKRTVDAQYQLIIGAKQRRMRHEERKHGKRARGHTSAKGLSNRPEE